MPSSGAYAEQNDVHCTVDIVPDGANDDVDVEVDVQTKETRIDD